MQHLNFQTASFTETTQQFEERNHNELYTFVVETSQLLMVIINFKNEIAAPIKTAGKLSSNLNMWLTYFFDTKYLFGSIIPDVTRYEILSNRK